MKQISRNSGEFIYLCFFLPLVGVMSVGKGSLWPPYKYIFAVCMIACLIKIVFTNYTRTEWVAFSLCLLFICFNYLHNGERKLFLALMALYAVKGVRLHKVICYSLWLRVICVMVTMIAAGCGFIETTFVTLPKHGILVSLNTYGYTHPNHSILYVFTSCILVIMTYYDKICRTKLRYGVYTILTMVMYISYRVFLGRTAWYSWVLLIIFILLFERVKGTKLQEKYLKLQCCIPILCLAFTLLGLILYKNGNGVGHLFDQIMTGRIGFFWDSKPVFSKVILFGGDTRGFADLGYASFVYNYGWIFALLCFFIYTYAMYYYAKNGEGMIVGVLAVMAVYLLMEEMPLNIVINISLIYLGKVLFPQNRDEYEEYEEHIIM